MPPVLMVLKTTGNVEELKRAYDASCRDKAGEHARGPDWGIPRVALQHVCAFADDAMYVFDIFKDEDTQRNLVFNRDALPENLRPLSGAISSSTPHKALSQNQSLQDRFSRDAQILKVHVVLPNLASLNERPSGLSFFE